MSTFSWTWKYGLLNLLEIHRCDVDVFYVVNIRLAFNIADQICFV